MSDEMRVISTRFVFMNTFMTIFIFVKLNMWMRLNDNFSQLYTLFKNCIKDISLFLIYFVYWVFFFSFMFMVVGGNFHSETGQAGDYPNISNVQVYVL